MVTNLYCMFGFSWLLNVIAQKVCEEQYVNYTPSPSPSGWKVKAHRMRCLLTDFRIFCYLKIKKMTWFNILLQVETFEFMECETPILPYKFSCAILPLGQHGMPVMLNGIFEYFFKISTCQKDVIIMGTELGASRQACWVTAGCGPWEPDW